MNRFSRLIAPVLSKLGFLGFGAPNPPPDEGIPAEPPVASGASAPASEGAETEGGQYGAGQEQPTTKTGTWLFAIGTHQGDRNNNEDRLKVLKPIVLADGRIIYATITADGMGGAQLGEEWARILCATVDDCWELLREQMSLPFGWPGSWAVPTLRQASAAIVRKKAELGLADLQTGTTGTLAIYLGEEVHTFHVGDSPALRFDGTVVEQFTQDHNLYSLLRSQFGPEADIQGKFKHILAAYLGNLEDAKLSTCDHNSVLVPVDGGIVVTTDGLLNEISMEEIAEILRLDESLESRAARLIALYAAAPSRKRDNATFVIGIYCAA